MKRSLRRIVVETIWPWERQHLVLRRRRRGVGIRLVRIEVRLLAGIGGVLRVALRRIVRDRLAGSRIIEELSSVGVEVPLMLVLPVGIVLVVVDIARTSVPDEPTASPCTSLRSASHASGCRMATSATFPWAIAHRLALILIVSWRASQILRNL